MSYFYNPLFLLLETVPKQNALRQEPPLEKARLQDSRFDGRKNGFDKIGQFVILNLLSIDYFGANVLLTSKFHKRKISNYLNDSHISKTDILF